MKMTRKASTITMMIALLVCLMPSTPYAATPDYLHEKIMSKDIANRVIELEKTGYIKIADGCKIYQEKDGGLQEKSLHDIRLGAENVLVYLNEKNEASMIKMEGDTPIKNIRVGIRKNLNNMDKSELYHDEIEMTSDHPFKILDKRNQVELNMEANTRVTFIMDAQGEINIMENNRTIYKTNNRMYAIPQNEEAKIYVTNIYRGSSADRFNPGYRGILEINTISGLNKMSLINEVPLEKYLLQVVPAEMPSSFGLEALKAQAVVARTFALNEVHNERFAESGYHVDDGTLSQVYNNQRENEYSRKAVDETKGKVMFYNGLPAEVFYYSSSGGYGAAKHEVWPDDITKQFPGTVLPYLPGKSYTYDPADGAKFYHIDTKSEEEIKSFYKNLSLRAIDSDSYYFRWKVHFTKEELENTINKNIKLRYAADPDFILTKDENGNYVSKPIPEEGVGKIKEIYVSRRGQGGNAMELMIEGTTGTYKIIKELNIRYLIRPRKEDTNSPNDVILYRAKGGSQDYDRNYSLNNFSILPSAFFAIEKERDEKNEIKTVTIYGGGYGHGVGMSQYGAKSLHEKGYTYDQILNLYYPGVHLDDMVESDPQFGHFDINQDNQISIGDLGILSNYYGMNHASPLWERAKIADIDKDDQVDFDDLVAIANKIF